MSTQHQRTLRVLNRVAKWRALLTGWQLGTRADTDPESNAVRDHREATLMLRVESTALASLLVEKGIFTQTEWDRMLERSGEQLLGDLERRFPGVRATDEGLSMNVPTVMEWMAKENWKR